MIAIFLLLALLVMLTIRFNTELQFHTTPLDYLMIFLALMIPILPEMHIGDLAVSILTAKLLVLYFSFELLLHLYAHRVMQLGLIGLWVPLGINDPGVVDMTARPRSWLSIVSGVIAVGFCGVVLACGGPEERKAMYRTRAQDYVQQGNYPKARVALRNALKIDPNDTESWFLFAQVEEREQNWRNAYGDYLRVVELQPDHEAALIKLGKIYLESRAYDKTREIADKLLAQHPGHAQGQALQIAVEAVNDAGDAALHHAESLYGAHPTAADAAMLLATLYASHNRHEDSERVLKQALVAQPRDVEVLNALASAYLRSGKLHLAEQTFRQILNSDPATLEYRLRLAGFYDQQKDYDKAETVLREAIQAEPQHVQRHLTLADFLATRRGPAQGERILLDAVETHPRATELHFALGRLYERSGQNAEGPHPLPTVGRGICFETCRAGSGGQDC